MKKYLMMTLVSILSVSSAFAESATSKLISIETASCDSSEIERTIVATADNVRFDSTGLTVLEEVLEMTAEQKTAGLHAEVVKAATSKLTLKSYLPSVEVAEAAAKSGKVGITKPAKFYLVFAIKDKTAQEKLVTAGHIDVEATCRVETRTVNGQETVKHSAQLATFEVKAKGVKK